MLLGTHVCLDQLLACVHVPVARCQVQGSGPPWAVDALQAVKQRAEHGVCPGIEQHCQGLQAAGVHRKVHCGEARLGAHVNVPA